MLPPHESQFHGQLVRYITTYAAAGELSRSQNNKLLQFFNGTVVDVQHEDGLRSNFHDI